VADQVVDVIDSAVKPRPWAISWRTTPVKSILWADIPSAGLKSKGNLELKVMLMSRGTDGSYCERGPPASALAGMFKASRFARVGSQAADRKRIGRIGRKNGTDLPADRQGRNDVFIADRIVDQQIANFVVLAGVKVIFDRAGLPDDVRRKRAAISASITMVIGSEKSDSIKWAAREKAAAAAGLARRLGPSSTRMCNPAPWPATGIIGGDVGTIVPPATV